MYQQCTTSVQYCLLYNITTAHNTSTVLSAVQYHNSTQHQYSTVCCTISQQYTTPVQYCLLQNVTSQLQHIHIQYSSHKTQQCTNCGHCTVGVLLLTCRPTAVTGIQTSGLDRVGPEGSRLLECSVFYFGALCSLLVCSVLYIVVFCVLHPILTQNTNASHWLWAWWSCFNSRHCQGPACSTRRGLAMGRWGWGDRV